MYDNGMKVAHKNVGIYGYACLWYSLVLRGEAKCRLALNIVNEFKMTYTLLDSNYINRLSVHNKGCTILHARFEFAAICAK